jgi:nucleoside-diphosphate-sugar epimerase
VSEYTLLTGATGLVGRYLIRDLLLAGERLAVLVRPSKKQSAAARVESVMQMWETELGRPLPRPVCLEGDVTEPGLGLDLASRRWVAKHCPRLMHNAAVLTFHGSDREGEPWRTNLQGTRTMLQFCKELNIEDLHYVSTAYVAGRREGRVMEDELDCGQRFRNDYENSKFLAETMVREADHLRQLTVYRPGIIAGDTKTGYSSTYHGLYFYLKLISVLVRNETPDANGVRHTKVRLQITGNELRHIVPIDWISAVMCRLFLTPAAHGSTFHLVPSHPITPRYVLECAMRYYNSVGVEFVGPKRFPDDQLNDLEKNVYSNTTMYESYDTTDPIYDMTNLRRYTADLPDPRIDEEMIYRFIRYGEQDRWGKRREPPLQGSSWVGEYLKEFILEHELGAANSFAGRASQRWVGLDVAGPWGGQWSLKLAGEKAICLENGIVPDCAAVFRLTTQDLSLALHGTKALRQLREGRRIESQGNGALLESLFQAIRLPALTNGHASEAQIAANVMPRV